MHTREISLLCTVEAASLSINEWKASRALERVGDTERQNVSDLMEKVLLMEKILHT